MSLFPFNIFLRKFRRKIEKTVPLANMQGFGLENCTSFEFPETLRKFRVFEGNSEASEFLKPQKLCKIL